MHNKWRDILQKSDSSCQAQNEETIPTEAQERKGMRDSLLFHNALRALRPGEFKITVKACGGAQIDEFLDILFNRFGKDRLMKGQ
jgi:hypothetical protein